jgi:hypothetical protein
MFPSLRHSVALCVLVTYPPYSVHRKEAYCGVFTPCKNCNIETRSHDYATVEEAVFSPCRAEPRCAVPWRVAHRLAWPRLVCCQATAINTWMTQEWGGVSSDVTRFNSDATIEAPLEGAFPACQIKGL